MRVAAVARADLSEALLLLLLLGEEQGQLLGVLLLHLPARLLQSRHPPLHLI